jgi:hypothetical protein
MNGHTFLRSYRVIMLLGTASFLYSMFSYTMPDDWQTEE